MPREDVDKLLALFNKERSLWSGSGSLKCRVLVSNIERDSLRTLQICPAWMFGSRPDAELSWRSSVDGVTEWSSRELNHDHWMSWMAHFDHPTWLYLVPRFTVMGNELNFDLEVGLQVDGLCDAITDAEEILYWMGTGLPWHHAYESEWRD
jgi:hypothetical protein